MKKIKYLMFTLCLMLSLTFVACNDVTILTLSTIDNITTVQPGTTLQFATEISESNLDGLTYEITHGEDYASISNSGLLSVSETAVPDSLIKVVSKLLGVTSNEVTITVTHIQPTSISLSSKARVLPNNSAALNAVVTPTNSTIPVSHVIVEGSEYAEIVNGRVNVASNAPSEAKIKIKAVAGNVESEVITIVVGTPTDENLYLVLEDSVTIKHPSSSISTIITATVLDEYFEPIVGQNVDFDIIAGNEFLKIEVEDYNCKLSVLGHGTAIVRATLDNGESYETTVNCIKTPTAITLPNVFSTRNNIHYAFSNAYNLDFSVGIKREKVCKDVTYVFKSGSYDGNGVLVFAPETTPGAIGTYNASTKQISFNTSFTGLAELTIISNSGNDGNEVSVSQIFEINKGVNVSTWEEFYTALSKNYTDKKPINFVVLNQLGNGYDYELVPSRILDGTQDVNYVANNLYKTAYGSATINGNNHNINLSNLMAGEPNPDRGNNAQKQLIIIAPYTEHLLNINPQADLTDYLNEEFEVIIKNFRLIGNNSVTGIKGSGNPFGSFGEGLRVGYPGRTNAAANESSHNPNYEEGEVIGRVPCKLTMDNVYISNFINGLKIVNAIDGHVSNTTVENCFSTAIHVTASIVTFENMTYGYCGAFGIEFNPNDADAAGVDFDQPQQIKFIGTVTCTNINNGETLYLQNFKFGTLTITDLMKVSLGISSDMTTLELASLSNIALSNSGGLSFTLIALILNNPISEIPPTFEENPTEFSFISNEEIVEYSTDMGIDTEHKYIKLTIVNPLNPASAPVGYVICYNLNYTGD